MSWGTIIIIVSVLFMICGFILRWNSRFDVNDFNSMAREVQRSLNKGRHGTLEVGSDISSRLGSRRSKSTFLFWLSLIGLIAGIIMLNK